MKKLLIIIAILFLPTTLCCYYRGCTPTTKKPTPCCVYEQLEVEKLIKTVIKILEVDPDLIPDDPEDKKERSENSCCKFTTGTIKYLVDYAQKRYDFDPAQDWVDAQFVYVK